MSTLRKTAALMLILFGCTGEVFGAHPLITDDTGTQGRGKLQVETNYEYDYGRNNGVVEKADQIQSILTYGIVDTVDAVFTLPYLHILTKAEGERTTASGLSDASFEVKWRFFEWKHFSLAVKPGVIFPTGDDEKGLGAGKVGASFFLIATQELKPWTFDFNAGYRRNENTVAEHNDIWHVSLAAELEIFTWVKAVANVGVERNPDRVDSTPAAFILGGFIFQVTENVQLDVGVKGGLTEAESDYAFLTGATFRF